MAIEQLTGQAAGTHGFDRVVAACGVRQDGVAIRRQHIEQVRFARVLADVGTTHGNGDDLGTRGFDGQAGFFKVTVFTGADQQARLEGTAGQGKGLVAAKVAHRKSSEWLRDLQGVPGALAAADGMHDFDLIAFTQRCGCVLATWHDIQVELYRDTAPDKVQAGQQGLDAFAIGQLEGFTVQLNAHAHGHHYF
ncbi:hypothetical protein D3C78_469730 [compost metagenome]